MQETQAGSVVCVTDPGAWEQLSRRATTPEPMLRQARGSKGYPAAFATSKALTCPRACVLQRRGTSRNPGTAAREQALLAPARESQRCLLKARQ